MRHQKLLIMRIMTTLDTIRLNEVLLASSYWTSQMSYEAAAMCFRPARTGPLIPLDAAHAHIDDNRYVRSLNVVVSASLHLTSSDYL